MFPSPVSRIVGRCPPLRVHRAVVAVVATLVAAVPCGAAGCARSAPPGALDVPPPSEPQTTEARRLRERFAAHASAILDGGEGFAVTDPGFARPLPAEAAGWGRLGIELPLDATQPVRLTTAAGVAVRVREVGLEGVGQSASHAVAYRRAGGTSFWTVATGAVEEWIHLEPGVARGGEAVAAWEVEGATLRQGQASVQLLDPQGRALMHVTAPAAYAESGRALRAHLEARGGRIELFVDSGEVGREAILVDPSWSAAGVLNHPRYGHTATLLPDGKVLVVGGLQVDGSPAHASFPTNLCELYDPATNLWSFAASLTWERSGHVAVLLPDGKVLTAGGANDSGTTPFVEIYDPGADTWITVTSMTTARTLHGGVLLPSGKVLVVGGEDTSGIPLATAEVYDPGADTWSAVASMPDARDQLPTVLLPSGKVLVIGGDGSSGTLASTLLYDPGADAWSSAGSMATARAGDAPAVLLPSGKVLIGGGLAACELYDPAANAWSPTGSMTVDRDNHTFTRMPNGTVLAVGGMTVESLASAEIYDPSTGAWSATASMATPRYSHTATLLDSGEVLVASGRVDLGDMAETAELYIGSTGVTCTATSECGTGYCVDGYCCDTACPGGSCSSGSCVPSSSSSTSGSTSASSTSASSTSGSSTGSSGGGSSSSSTSSSTSASSTGAGGAGGGTGAGGMGGGSPEASTSSGGGAAGTKGGCGCSAAGSSGGGAMWLTLGALLLMRRRPLAR